METVLCKNFISCRNETIESVEQGRVEKALKKTTLLLKNGGKERQED